MGLLIQTFDETRAQPGFEPLEILVLFQITYMLCLLTFIKRSSARALETFKPVFTGSDEEFSLLRLYITSMPARTIRRLTFLFFVVFGFILVGLGPSIARSQANLASYTFTLTPVGYFGMAVGTFLWLINTIFIYNTIHQLRMIHLAYTQFAEINLFSQTELYAFSRVLATRSIGIVLTSPIWLMVDSGLITLGVDIVFSVLAIIIFIVPLVGVRRLLEDPKDALLKESGNLKRDAIRDFFSGLSEGERKLSVGVGQVLSDLSTALREIDRISTWPWQTNTLRQISGAVTLPILIWTIQFFLGRMLGS